MIEITDIDSKRGRGHPRSFSSNDDFFSRFLQYLDFCEDKKKFPNIAGFCMFCDITRETFYASQSYYSDAFEKIQQALEDSTLNDKNTIRSIFYLKNKFGYTDKQEISANVNQISNISEEEINKKLQSILSKYIEK